MQRYHILCATSLALLLAGCPALEPVTSCSEDADCFEDVGYVCDTTTELCLKECAADSDCIGSGAVESCDTSVSPQVCRTIN